MSSQAPITRRARRQLETRQRILAAAAELFGEQGVQATKVSDICQSADIAHQTFFNHFRSKADLVRELVGAGCDFVAAAAFEAQREGETTGARIALFFSRILDATIDAGPMHHELLAETFRASQTDADREGLDRIREAILALVHSGIAAGEVTRRHAPEDLALLVIGTLQTLMFEWASAPDFPIAERAEHMARLLAHAIAPAPDERASRPRSHLGRRRRRTRDQ
jgi:AcrR family transcriptional regulator